MAARARGLFRGHDGPLGAERPPEWYDAKFSATPEYHASYQDSPYYFLWSVIVDRIRPVNARRVLEVGCGTGQLAAYLFDQGIDSYAGFDFSPKAVEYARRSAPRGRFTVDDARSSGIYETEEYDVLVCTEVLEHITEDLDVVNRFHPQTRCIFSVPSYNSAGHVRFFRDQAAVAERYGGYFDELSVVEFPIPGTTAADLNKIFLADGERNTVVARD